MQPQPGQTIGISPKVTIPATALTVLGVALLIVGFILGGDDGGTLRDVGFGLVGGGPLAGLVGFGAHPGDVVPSDEIQPSSDSLLRDALKD